MSHILHIEPINRSVEPPLSIGETDNLFYGEGELQDEENLGDSCGEILLGAPLSSVDMGSTCSHLPLVKTFEYSPDHSQRDGNVFTETLHYLKDGKILIPFRTRIRSGKAEGTRFNHLPSLNEVRKILIGLENPVCDPKPEIISSILTNDRSFVKRADHPIMDWIRDDLTSILSSIAMNKLYFDTSDILDSLYRYINQVSNAPFADLSQRHQSDILLTLTHDPLTIPIHYSSTNPIHKSIYNFRDRIVPNTVNLRSFGNIDLTGLPMISRNPKSFTSVVEFLDKLSLTDINLDVVLSDGDIAFAHTHTALDRLSQFKDQNLSHISPEDILEQELHPEALVDILTKFVQYHPTISGEAVDTIVDEPVKMKIIKTITDEAVILVYKYNAADKEKPLCGVYFDIAALSIAPLSVIPGYLGVI